MKPVAAMGLLMVMVGAMVALGPTMLRPVGGALLICGVVMGVYGSLPRGSRSTRQHGPYSWEKEENSGPREFYTANPSEVRLKLRQQTQEPQFTTPRPGSIPTSRQQVPAAPSPLADMLNSEPFDMPPIAARPNRIALAPMIERSDMVVVGAGQAGLSISHELAHAGVDHVVLERNRVAETWRSRWDSFCLVTPNWMTNLPGQPYAGTDPDGFMPRDELVDYFGAYADSFKAPVREGVQVTELVPRDDGGFLLRTSAGDFETREVVIASGGYQKPFRPTGAADLPPAVQVIDVEDYTNPGALPEGGVLVIGSGQTGCQLAEELFESGRETFLACGRAPWLNRRIEGRDTMDVLVNETPFMEMTLAMLPSPMARLAANPQASGHGGGHDLNYRTLQAMGVKLLGRFAGADGRTAHFADDLSASVAFGDARYLDLCGLVAKSFLQRGAAPPEMPPPPPFHADPPRSIDLQDFGAVIFTAGFRPDYSWVKAPGGFDEMGFPRQVDGSSTVVPGLHFMGVHFQRKRKSAALLGVAEDATVLAERMLART